MCKITISPVVAFLVLFVALKLCGVISWSWLWVLSPLWVPLLVGFGVVAVILLVTVVVALLVGVAGAISDSRRNRRK